MSRGPGGGAGAGDVGDVGDVELEDVGDDVGADDDGCDTLTTGSATVNNVALASSTELLVFSVVLALLTAVANFVVFKALAL